MLKNGIYNLLAAIVRNGVGVVAVPILIRTMGLESYGLWVLVNTTISIVTLAQSGLSVSTTVFIAKDLGANDREGVLKTISINLCLTVLLSTLVAIILFAFSPQFVDFFPKISLQDKELAISSLRIGAVAIWTKLIQSALSGIAQGFEEYKMINLISTLQILFVNASLIILASLQKSIVILMVSQSFISAIILLLYVFNTYHIISYLKPYFFWDTDRAKEMLQYSSMTWLISLSTNAFGQGDKIVVGYFLEPSKLGIYSAITMVASQINNLSATLVQPILPSLGSLLRSGDKDSDKNSSISKLVKKSIISSSAIAGAISIGLTLLSSYIILLIYEGDQGTNYIAILSLQVSCLIYTLYSVNATGYYIMFVMNKLRELFLIIALGSMVSLALIGIGAANAGLIGACIGNIGYILTTVITFVAMGMLKISNKNWLTWCYVPFVPCMMISLVSIIVSINKVFS